MIGDEDVLEFLNTVRVGETPEEMIELGLEIEEEAIERLQRGVALTVEKGDIGTREMLAGMVAEEEEHADYFRTQLDVVERIGLQNYLARYTTPEST